MNQNRIDISDYFSDDGSKKAIVFKQDRGYGVDFYQNEEYDHTLLFTSKSLQYVEDTAENYVLGINKNYRLFKEV
jgi:hypothetical protein